MTDRFKEAENWLVNVGSQADGSTYGDDMCKILHEALTLASGAEQLRKKNEELKAKLDKLKWQPIETAPKDGTRIIVKAKYFTDDKPVYIAQNWRDTFNGTDDWKGESSVGQIDLQPVEWMPLPDAPEQR